MDSNSTHKTEGELVYSSNSIYLHREALHEDLKNQPWCKGLTYEDFCTAINSSYCLGLYNRDHSIQYSFLRCITDFVTFTYVTDVITDKEFQGKGYGTKLLDFMFKESGVKHSKEFFLIAETPGIYSKFGFKPFRYKEMFFSRSPKNDNNREYENNPWEYYND